MAKIHRLPTASQSQASYVQIMLSRVKMFMGILLRNLGIPGLIGNVDIKDQVSNQRIQVDVGVLFTRLSVNERDYYFNRLTGKFDGTGSGCMK